MKILKTNDRGMPTEVELTEAEMEAKDRFDDLLDEGRGIPDAAITALEDHWLFGRPPAMKERGQRTAFVNYLSDDTVVALSNGGYTIKVGFRSLTTGPEA